MPSRGQLSADLVSWLSREDVGASPLFDSLLRNVEARIRRDVRPRERDKTVVLEITQQATELPSDFVRARSLTIDSQLERALDYYTPDSLRKSPIWVNRSSFSTGTIQGYTIEGTQLIVAPNPSADSPVNLTLVYVASYEPLSRGASTNYLVENAYDIYLYGLLVEAAIYLEDQELLEQYKMRFGEAAASFNRAENRARFPKSGLRTIGHPHEIV